jgi:hypothetical protein
LLDSGGKAGRKNASKGQLLKEYLNAAERTENGFGIEQPLNCGT